MYCPDWYIKAFEVAYAAFVEEITPANGEEAVRYSDSVAEYYLAREPKNVEQSIVYLKKSLAVCEAVFSLNQSLKCMRMLSVSHTRLAETMAATKKESYCIESLEHFKKAAALLFTLAEKWDSQQSKEDLCGIMFKIGRLEFLTKDTRMLWLKQAAPLAEALYSTTGDRKYLQLHSIIRQMMDLLK